MARGAAKKPAGGGVEDGAAGVAAVDRALKIVESFKGTDGTQTLAMIAARTGFYKSTILRLSNSLESFGYVRRLENGTFKLGPVFLELSDLYRNSFRLEDHVVPALKALVSKTEESGSFYVRDREDRLCLFRVESSQAVRDHVRAGDRLPLQVGAAGRVLTNFADLSSFQGRAAKDFVVVTLGERQPDTAAIAAPVFEASGALAGAIGVSGPRIRFTRQMVASASKIVLHEAMELSVTLGAPRDLYPAK